MGSRNSLIWFSLCMAAAASCGGGSGSSPPGNADEFFRRYNEALCTRQVACGDMPDQTTCLAVLQFDTTESLTVKADVASGKVHYDSAKAAACLAYAERLYGAACTQTAIAAVGTTGSDVCDEVFVGTVADGGACTTSFQCASASCKPTDPYCQQDRQCCVGSCVAKRTPIPAGADCGGSLDNLNCEAGSVCTVSAAVLSPKCITPSKVAGTACIVAAECAPPLFCDIDVATSMGTCQPVAATGAPCNLYIALGVCDDLRDFCGVATSTCAPRGAPGAPCNLLDPNSCLGYAQCIGSTCVALSPEERAACDPTNGPGCLGSLECSTQTNTCGFPAVAGACP